MCIRDSIYGGQVALPVFKEIADRAMATKLELYPVLNAESPVALESSQLPDHDAGYTPDLKKVLGELDIDYINRSEGNWAVLRSAAPDSLKLVKRPIEDKKVPNVLGMGLRDALYLLENRGLRVQVNGGYGKVRQQSVPPGTRAAGQVVYLRLG